MGIDSLGAGWLLGRGDSGSCFFVGEEFTPNPKPLEIPQDLGTTASEPEGDVRRISMHSELEPNASPC